MGSGVGSISLHDKGGRGGGYIQRGDSVVIKRGGGKGEPDLWNGQKKRGFCNICIGRFWGGTMLSL